MKTKRGWSVYAADFFFGAVPVACLSCLRTVDVKI
jgi:hypothetical protein